ncbi:MAG: LysR substrate-binding domain-containing protein [Candidatus Contendobacter sp.]
MAGPQRPAETVDFTAAAKRQDAECPKELALADAGIAALPEPLARAELELGQLVRLLPAHRLPVLHFHAVYLGNLAPPAKTRAFIDLAKERIRDRL